MGDLAGIRILLVEDNEGAGKLYTELLESAGGSPEWVTRLSQAKVRLQTTEPVIDAILLDLSLPNGWGEDTFQQISSAAGGAAVVVLTGTNDEQLASTLVALGAQDYLYKGAVTPSSLVRAVHYAVLRNRWQSRREVVRERVQVCVQAIKDTSEKRLRLWSFFGF